ncbi:glycogen synthase [Rhodohalobacter halophilus]|uniref:glycogen synthase n=1 Tax=Rhodohalobacter halophilus TaxID=1812810 RepID=UPI00083FAC86|nr:glycogen/starch synthase [Rhodohalobacter halophilus]
MNIVHISAECYPYAKAGGLGDVVGALPKYLNQSRHQAMVILPYYYNERLRDAEKSLVYEGQAPLGVEPFAFRVYKVDDSKDFDLYVIDIPGRFDRPGIYIDPWSGHAYWDEKERFISYQVAALEWLKIEDFKPDIIHSHDHHTALIPFMMGQAFRFENFRETPSILTIHNGEYQGRYSRDDYDLLPAFNLENIGLLDWDGALNSLAAGIKTAWSVTTVSEGYMEELLEYCHGLEQLLRHEKEKTIGIVNGIDSDVWNPETDQYIGHNYSKKSSKTGKSKNKKILCNEFEVDPKSPVFSFIGRLVREKGADLLPSLIQKCSEEGVDASFIVLGTGDPSLHEVFDKLSDEHFGYFDTRLEYNEQLAHQIYAGSDFLLMPSRVEPCGLNQLYAMRYGTIPVVRKTGGLADTVKDLHEKSGYGIVFDEFSVGDAYRAVERGVELFAEKALFKKKVEKVMSLDYSWRRSTEKYISLYNSLIKS